MLVAARLRFIAGTKWGTKKYVDAGPIKVRRTLSVVYFGRRPRASPLTWSSDLFRPLWIKSRNFGV